MVSANSLIPNLNLRSSISTVSKPRISSCPTHTSVELYNLRELVDFQTSPRTSVKKTGDGAEGKAKKRETMKKWT